MPARDSQIEALEAELAEVKPSEHDRVAELKLRIAEAKKDAPARTAKEESTRGSRTTSRGRKTTEK